MTSAITDYSAPDLAGKNQQETKSIMLPGLCAYFSSCREPGQILDTIAIFAQCQLFPAWRCERGAGSWGHGTVMEPKLQQTSLLQEGKELLHVRLFPWVQIHAVRRWVTVTADENILNWVTPHAKPQVMHGLWPRERLGNNWVRRNAERSNSRCLCELWHSNCQSW